MASVSEVMQLCRLCLVKDEVNIPIFEEQGDIRQIFLKISACLPVKVARDDNLPKRICDGCSCKLEMLYQFWHTSAQAEKKLIKWINEITYDKSANKVISTVQHSNDPMILKQEVVDVGDTHSSSDELVPEDLNASDDAQDYLMQQQQLPYQNVEYFEEDGLDEEPIIEAPTLASTQPKRKRRAAEMQRAITANTESEDEDDVDHLLGAKITKTEEQSDEGDDPEPTTFVGLPTATDNEQPGPSGVGKSATDAPITVKMEDFKCEDDSIKSSSITEIRTKRAWCCKKCDEVFDTSRKLREHRKVHRKEENDTQYNYKYDDRKSTFVCFTCDMEFNSKGDIETHLLEHEEKFVCEICGEAFVKPYEYSCHLFNHDHDKGFVCPFCKYSTNRRTAIMIHINTYHLRKYIYTCSLCGKGFNDCVLFKEHGNVHEGLKPFRCVVCSKDFAFSSYLTSHQLRNHKVCIDGVIGSNQCCVCSKTFTRKNTLEKHMNLHNLDPKPRIHEKKHLCDICGKGFSRTEKLRIHYRVHTGVKPYACSYCEKSFTKRDYMIMHERVHSGEKPYSCEYCGKCFNQGAPLRLHIRSHTGERPYRCHLCNTGFISRGVLNLHFRTCPGVST